MPTNNSIFQPILWKQMRYYAQALRNLHLPRINRGVFIICVFPLLSPSELKQSTWTYGPACVELAKEYLAHPLLRSRLEQCTRILLERKGNWIEDTKSTKRIHACMTLFATAAGSDSLYQQMLDQDFGGEPEPGMQARIACTDGFARQGTELIDYYGDAQEVRVPEDITVIGTHAFAASRSMRRVILPQGLTDINPFAFFICRQLEQIQFPERPVNIGHSAFLGCSGLADQQGFVIVEGCLYDSKGDHPHVVIPQGVKRISHMAFLSHRHTLQSITLPAGLQHIDGNAFTGCTQLRQVYLPSPSPIIAFNAFKDSPEVTFSSIHQEALGQQ